MRREVYIFLHAVAAGTFVFILQSVALKQSTETSAIWGVCFALAAAALAWHQTNR